MYNNTHLTNGVYLEPGLPLPPPPPPSSVPLAAPPLPQHTRRPSSRQEVRALLSTISSEQYNALTPEQRTLVRSYTDTGSRHKSNPSPSSSSSQPQQQQQQLHYRHPSQNGYGQAGGMALNQMQTNGGTATPTQPSGPPPPPPPAPTPSASSSRGQTGGTSFIEVLTKFHADRNKSFGTPTLEGRVVDMSALYSIVGKNGGCNHIHQNDLWGFVVTSLGYAPFPDGTHPKSRVAAIVQIFDTLIQPFNVEFQKLQREQMQQEQRRNQMHHQQQQQQQQQQHQPQHLSLTHTSPVAYTSPQLGAPQETFAVPRTHSRSGSFSYAQQVQQQQHHHQQQQQQQQQQQTAMAYGTSGVHRVNGASPGPLAMGISSNRSLQPSRAPTPSQLQYQTNNVQSEDVKGKGRARPDDFNLSQSQTGSPRTNVSRNGYVVAEPEKPFPSQPAKRKRMKIEYVPLSRNVDSYAGWRLDTIGSGVTTGMTKRDRNVHDLGNVDIFSLTMSLRSRLGAEVAFALNSLQSIGGVVKLRSEDDGATFPLENCGDLLEALLDLMEESAFGCEDDVVTEEETVEDRIRFAKDDARNEERLTYRTLFREIAQDQGELQVRLPSRWQTIAQDEMEGRCPLGAVEIILSVSNLLRTFAFMRVNERILRDTKQVVELVMRLAELPFRGGRSKINSVDGNIRKVEDGSLYLSKSDGLSLRKDALQILSNIGLHLDLSRHDEVTAQRIWRLLRFFLDEADHVDPLLFDFPSAVGDATKVHQLPYTPLSHYLDLALSAFARITTLDANRLIFARLVDPDTLFTLFLALIKLLPIKEKDFATAANEAGIVFIENLATSLYNLAFLAPPSIKLRLRVLPEVVKGLFRVIKRLAGTLEEARSSRPNFFVAFCQRCIFVLQLLNDAGTLSSSSSAVGGSGGGRKNEKDNRGGGGDGWFGLGVYDDDEDSGKIIRCTPTEAERGTVGVPRRSGHTSGGGAGGGFGANELTGVLSGDPTAVFELLQNGPGNVFGGLSKCLVGRRDG